MLKRRPFMIDFFAGLIILIILIYSLDAHAMPRRAVVLSTHISHYLTFSIFNFMSTIGSENWYTYNILVMIVQRLLPKDFVRCHFVAEIRANLCARAEHHLHFFGIFHFQM